MIRYTLIFDACVFLIIRNIIFSMISRDDVKYIANLSRIHLEEHELDFLSKDLTNILHYIEKLEKLDVSHVKPTTHVLPLQNVYREDKPESPLKQEEVLRFSVAHHNGSFKVPQVME